MDSSVVTATMLKAVQSEYRYSIPEEVTMVLFALNRPERLVGGPT
jgi:hypothetical protein